MLLNNNNSGYTKRRGDLDKTQIEQNRNLERHRGVIEKHFGAFQHSFKRFNKETTWDVPNTKETAPDNPKKDILSNRMKQFFDENEETRAEETKKILLRRITIMKRPELYRLLKERNLKTSGKVGELKNRLKEYESTSNKDEQLDNSLPSSSTPRLDYKT